MNASDPLIPAAVVRDALVNAAIAGALVLAACTVAALACELGNRWSARDHDSDILHPILVRHHAIAESLRLMTQGKFMNKSLLGHSLAKGA
jgi:hypothetical protein